MKEESIPKPTMTVQVCDGIANVVAYGRFTHKNVDYDWSLRRQQESEYDLARKVLLFHAKNKTLWAPKPITHTGIVVCPSETHFPENDLNTEGIIIRRGVYADGVVLHSKLDAFLITPADCATIVLSYEDEHGHRKVIAMHASRESLIDMSRFKNTKKVRQYEGVVASALARIPKKNIAFVRGWVGISVSPGPHFEHRIDDKNNPHNDLFVNYIREKYGNECFADDKEGGKRGWLDKRILVKKQLMLAGVPEENLESDTTCTYQEEDVLGKPRWYSHIRNQEERLSPFRNLVLIIRNH